MIAQLHNLDQEVQETAVSFPGDVVRIRYSTGHDWNGDPAIFLRILLSDNASRGEVLEDVTGRISGKLFDHLQLGDSEYTPYFNFRSKSEQDRLQDRNGNSRRSLAAGGPTFHPSSK
jgi:hypothetical protein